MTAKLILRFTETEDLSREEINQLEMLAEKIADDAAEIGILDVYLELDYKAGLQPIGRG